MLNTLLTKASSVGQWAAISYKHKLGKNKTNANTSSPYIEESITFKEEEEENEENKDVQNKLSLT